MAYPTIDVPYGLKPIQLIGGQPFAGATRKCRIKSGISNAIWYGDLVKRDTDGTIIASGATTTATASGLLGVFLGCEYINSVGQLTFSQTCPAGLTVTAGTITAYVCDDPDALFKIAVVSATTTVSGLQYSAVGENGTLVDNAGNTTSGVSRVALSDSTAVTASLPVKIVDVIPDTAYVSGSNTLYPEVIVKINGVYISATTTMAGGHAYNNPLGI